MSAADQKRARKPRPGSLTAGIHVYGRNLVRALEVEVTLPAEQPVRGAVLYFHGGGWFAGGRDDGTVGPRLHGLLAHGFAVAAADYSLSGEEAYPAQLRDAGDAFEWLAERLPEGAPLFLAGSSAGGHLAGLVGLGAWERLTGSAHTVRPTGVIGYAGVNDPLGWDSERERAPRPLPGTFAHWSLSRSGVWPPRRLGAALLSGGDAAVSPIVSTHVDVGAPPYLHIHGDADTCVSVKQSLELHAALGDRGATSTLLRIAGADHEAPEFAEPLVTGAVIGFVRQHGLHA
ncbi:alpha/beta hydrolase [Leucobacter weissii]|uniref:Alpha/beta hydrolase n=1 Tax=Leucobacter weissii TaxID=1983706 RepID=A0A939S5I1_9MICO|nr:alpha/beta hydrolase [Leucobacter weissii]MBO1901359.1 alpha/beta hydrolase [Leucobacter weissii]